MKKQTASSASGVSLPSWAPEALVRFRARQLESRKQHRERGVDLNHRNFVPVGWTMSPGFENTDDWRKRFLQRYLDHLMPEQRAEFERRLQSVYMGILPAHEGDALLLRLLTDQRMRSVWRAIEKRAKLHDTSVRVWLSCQSGIQGWRAEPKMTKAERSAHFREIAECAKRLMELMHQTIEMDHFSILRMISSEDVQNLMVQLKAPGAEEYDHEQDPVGFAKFCLSDLVPSLDLILVEIMTQAMQHATTAPKVLKPNGKNAALHYFVRHLSNHFVMYFGLPLHEHGLCPVEWCSSEA